jgi:hypothetical protein
VVVTPKLVQHGPSDPRNCVRAEGEPARRFIARSRLHQSNRSGAHELVQINLVMKPPSKLARDMVHQADMLLGQHGDIFVANKA